VLEVWHPKLLEIEYKQMPPIIKYITDQALNRLQRTNKLVAKLSEEKHKELEEKKSDDPMAAKRRYYRKVVNIHCDCRALRPTTQKNLSGNIKDISLGGAGLEVKISQSDVFPFRPGDEFKMNTTLPNGKKIEFISKLASIKEGASENTLFLGVSFTNISEHSAKNLGFYLMK
jgi:hypothetical protein